MAIFKRTKKYNKDEKKDPAVKVANKPEAKKTAVKKAEVKKAADKKVNKKVTRYTDAYRILVRPIITEKIANLSASQNTYAFEVTEKANKREIKNAIKQVYGVEPKYVNVLNIRGKVVRTGRTWGKRKNWKKALVTLKRGDSIEIVPSA